MPHGPRVDELRRLRPATRGSRSPDRRRAPGDREPDRARAGADARARTWLLSAQVQAYAIALTLVVPRARCSPPARSPSERDENVIGRLARGLAGLGRARRREGRARGGGRARARAGRSRSSSGSRSRSGRHAAASRGRACRSSRVGAARSPARRSARSARSSARSRATRARPRSSRCSSCCRSCSSGSCRREVVPVGGLGRATRSRSPTPCASSARALYDASPWRVARARGRLAARARRALRAVARRALSMRRLLA